MRGFLIQDSNIFPHGQWVKIANKNEKENNDNDDEIYHYVGDCIDLDEYKAGDYIELDFRFKILEVENGKGSIMESNRH